MRTMSAVRAAERPRDRSEVVDDWQAFEVQRAASARLRESPADVDHLDIVADDQCGDGQRGAGTVARAAVIEIDAQDALNSGEVGVLEDSARARPCRGRVRNV